jgi:phosphate transport system substrate-binding protein
MPLPNSPTPSPTISIPPSPISIITTPDRNLSTFTCGGSTLLGPLVREWLYGYTLIETYVKVEYQFIGSGGGITGLIRNTLDFAFSDRRVTASEHEQVSDIQIFPYGGSSVAVIFNVPELNQYFADKDKYEYTPDNFFVIGRQTLADIFSSIITYWDDPQIISDNTPGFATNFTLPHVRINVIVRKESSGTTEVFTSGLSSLSPEFNATYHSFSQWTSRTNPISDVVLNPNNTYILATSNEGLATRVFDIPYSIGYVASSEIGSVESLYALIPNKLGELTDPLNTNKVNLDVVTNADYRDSVELIDLNMSGYYPIVGVSYLLVRPDINLDCENRREAFLFLRFSLLPTSTIRSIGLSRDYLLPANTTTDEVLMQLNNFTCDDNKILDVIVRDSHSSDAFPVLLALNMFALAAFIGSGIYFIITIPATRKNEMIRFSASLLMGGFLSFFVTIFWYLVPDQDYVCQIRQWLTAVGVTLMMIALAARNWNLLQIFLRRKEFFSYEASLRDINLLMAILLFCQLVIMVVWTSVDFTSAHQRYVDDILLVVEWECHCDHWGLWMGLEVGMMAVILIFMIVTIYFVWKFSADIIGHKYTVMSIYNLIMIFCVLIVIYATTTTGDRSVALTSMVGLLVATSSTLFLNFHISVIMHGGNFLDLSSKTISKEQTQK